MKLDRNINDDGMGKYALILMRELADIASIQTDLKIPKGLDNAIRALENVGVIDWGERESEGEFFLIRLKDKYAQPALVAYAEEAEADDPEWAAEVRALAARSGPAHPSCKRPD